METDALRDSNRQSDHDNIVTLVAEVKNARVEIKEIKEDVKEVKNDIVSRISLLESEKADKAEVTSLNSKISWLQSIAYTGIGISIGLNFYFAYLHH